MSKGKRKRPEKRVHTNKYARFSRAENAMQEYTSGAERERKQRQKEQERQERAKRVGFSSSSRPYLGGGSSSLFLVSPLTLYENNQDNLEDIF